MSSLSASLPLAAYVETFCRQARVLWVGDARSALPKALLERGARLVYACDHDAGRRREAAARSQDRAITFGALDDGPAALREGFFDLALIENLAAESNAKEVLATVARLLAPRGVALVAAPNPDSKRPLLSSAPSRHPLDYYALYDAVVSTLPEVRMLGQVPFVGYAVVDFSAEGDPSPVLDSSLAPARGEEPDYFLALPGRERRALEEYAVIQVPAADVLQASSSRAELPGKQRATNVGSAALEQKLAKQEAWIQELEARAATADERADTVESELDEARERLGNQAQAHSQERASLVRERDALKSELEQARRRLAEFDDRLAAKDSELSKLKAEAPLLKTKTETLEARSKSLEADATALKVKLEALEVEAAALRSEGETSSDLAQLEAQLQERGERVLGLERDLLESERVGRELVRKLREPATPGNAQALAERLALAEAELVTLRWSLELAKSGVSSPGNGARRLS